MAAVADGPDLADLPFKISTATATDGIFQIKVDLQIDATKVGFKTVTDKQAGRLRITIFYADAKGNYLGEDWKTMTLQLQEESYQRILRSRIPFSTLIPLKVPKQMLKVVVYDVGSDRLGSKLVNIK